MILGHLRILRLQQCDIGTIETSETSTLCVETKLMSGLAADEMSAAETGQMSSVETGKISAVETGWMYPAETAQTSVVEISPVSICCVCLVSTFTSKDRKTDWRSLAILLMQDGSKRKAVS